MDCRGVNYLQVYGNSPSMLLRSVYGSRNWTHSESNHSEQRLVSGISYLWSSRCFHVVEALSSALVDYQMNQRQILWKSMTSNQINGLLLLHSPLPDISLELHTVIFATGGYNGDTLATMEKFDFKHKRNFSTNKKQ